MRIGLLGGTFDPIHFGHMILAENAYDQYELDELWFMPSPDPPHKLAKEKSPYDVRFEMTRLAVDGRDGFLASDYEIKLEQPSYSAKTLASLHKDYPDDDFFFIIGEDSLDKIETWYEPAKVLTQATILVAGRLEDDDDKTLEDQIEYLTEKYNASIFPIFGDYIDISSTEIRKRVNAGLSISDLVPAEVEEYIWKEKLYIKSEKN